MKKEILRCLEAMETDRFGSPQIAKFLIRVRRNPEDLHYLSGTMGIDDRRVRREANLFLIEAKHFPERILRPRLREKQSNSKQRHATAKIKE